MYSPSQRHRIEEAVLNSERNPPRQPEEIIPQSQIIGSADNIARVELITGDSWTSSDTGWNQITGYHFRHVTNIAGHNGTSASEFFSWSGVFDSREDETDSAPTSPDGNLKVKKAGTYFGVIKFNFLASTGTESTTIDVGDVITTYTETDSGKSTWQAGTVKWTLAQTKDIDFRVTLYVTHPGNTTNPDSMVDNFNIIGDEEFEFEGDVITKNSEISMAASLTIPFAFALTGDAVPAEIQPWLDIDSVDSLQLRTNPDMQGWVKYSPNLLVDPFSELSGSEPSTGPIS